MLNNGGGLEVQYEPSESFRAKAVVTSRDQYDKMYHRSLEDPDGFWGELASELYFHKLWDGPIESYNFDISKGPVRIEWFAGAKTNMSYNCLDRNIERGLGEKRALVWEGNDPSQQRSLTYTELRAMVCKIANVLKGRSVGRGDDVTIYMPMIPELPATMLACTRIGAVHSVVFGGFSAEALSGRMCNSKPKVIVTASSCVRGAKTIDFKRVVDEAIARTAAAGHSVESCVVLQHPTGSARAEFRMEEARVPPELTLRPERTRAAPFRMAHPLPFPPVSVLHPAQSSLCLLKQRLASRPRLSRSLPYTRKSIFPHRYPSKPRSIHASTRHSPSFLPSLLLLFSSSIHSPSFHTAFSRVRLRSREGER